MEKPVSPPVRYRIGERVPLRDTGFTLRYSKPASISESDVVSVIEVVRRAFNGRPSWFSLGVDPADHFRWKTASAPGDAIVELVEADDDIIGLKLSFRQRFSLRDTEVTVEVGNDTAIDPSYQGRGINRILGEVRPGVIPLDPACLVLDQTMHPFFKGANTHPIGNQIDALVKPLSLRKMFAGRRSQISPQGPSHTRSAILGERHTSFLWSILKKLPFAIRLGTSMFTRSRISTASREYSIQTADRFDDRADTFWQEAVKQFDLIQVRDQTWLNWRYCDARGGPFTVRIAEQDGVLLGYSALRVTEAEAVIADLLVLPGRGDVAESLIADAVELGRRAGVAKVRCWTARRHPYRQSLDHAGFVRHDLPAPVVFAPGTCSLVDLEFLTHPTTRVHFMTADTEHV